VSGLAVLLTCGILTLFSVLAIVVLVVVKPSADSRSAGLSVQTASTRKGVGSGSGSGRKASGGHSSSSSGTALRLVQAGLYRRNAMAVFVAVKFGLALIPMCVGVMAGVMGWVTLMQGCFAGVVLGLLGTIMPSLWLDSAKRGRQMKLRRSLPDALDVIVVCIEAGLSMQASIARVARELRSAHPMLAAELLIVEREIQLGCTAGQALRRFADRFDLEELRSLASVILNAEKFGASIATALRIHSESLRLKRFQRAEEKAQTASAKLLFPTIVFIFPALYVVLLGPAVFDLMKFMKQMKM
jgi:tight adherence protein C